MIFDGKQDETFLVLEQQRFLLILDFDVLLVLLRGILDSMFLADDDGGVFLSLARTREVLLENRDGEVSFRADVHF